MYNEYFGFQEPPFAIAPDPRYLYMSEAHREALAHLLYGVNSDGGFVLLTGEVGTGKTTVCRCLLEQLPEDVEIAFVINPKLTSAELLGTICDDLGIAYPQGNTSIKVFVDRINAYLLDAHGRGRKTVLIIDEAQNLSVDVLEQLRLLTNLETNQRKLLQIILLGQPELQQILEQPDLRQLAQRITARFHLGALSKQDVSTYIGHRLAVAGLSSPLFPAETIDRLYRLTGGVPRLINVLCDRALLGTYVQGKGWVDRKTLERAAREVCGDPEALRPRRAARWWVLASLALIAGGIALWTAHFRPELLNAALNVSTPASTLSDTEPASARPVADSTGIVAAVVPLQPLDWPADQPIETSKVEAYQALFHAWGIDYRPDEDGNACQHAEELGLRCLFKRGSLGSLRLLNRPAVLKLLNAPGEEFYATLMALGGDRATFAVGKGTRQVSLKELETRWLGEFALLWKVPAGHRDEIHPGERGPEVARLDGLLARINQRPPVLAANPALAGSLLAELKAFQYSRGLEPDGILGTQTLIHLNAAAGQDVPLLNVNDEE